MTTTYSSESLHPNGHPSTTLAATTASAAAGAVYASGPPQSMDARSTEYSQSGTQEPPDALASTRPHSDLQPIRTDHSSATHYTPATPDSNYSLNPSSARSGTFPDPYLPRNTGYPDGSQRYPPNSTPNGAASNMAQPPSPSSMPSVDGQPIPSRGPPPPPHGPASNSEIPVDPSIAQSSPTYPPQHYSPYPTNDAHHMQYQTPHMYSRPEYPGAPPYSAPPQAIPYGHVSSSVGLLSD